MSLTRLHPQITLTQLDRPHTPPTIFRASFFIQLPDFMERDTVQRAVRALTAVGLLHRCGPLIFPSRAALRFDALEELSER